MSKLSLKKKQINSKRDKTANIKKIDKENKKMYKEDKSNINKESDTNAVTVEEKELQPAISPNVTSTKQPVKTIESLLKPLKNDAEDKLIASILNDVADLRPTRSGQNLAVYWKGKDIRIAEVQDSCPFHFSWKPKDKKQDYGVTTHVDGAMVVSKARFTVDGYRLVTTGGDATPNQDCFTFGDLILTFIKRENWLLDRNKKAIKATRKASDALKENKEKYIQSAKKLESGDIDGAIEAVSTRELLNRIESGDMSAVKDSFNDGLPTTIVKL